MQILLKQFKMKVMYLLEEGGHNLGRVTTVFFWEDSLCRCSHFSAHPGDSANLE